MVDPPKDLQPLILHGGAHDNPFPPKGMLRFEGGCDHEAEPVPCIVLGPFTGSGTTLRIARELGRKSIGIDLSRAYVEIAERWSHANVRDFFSVLDSPET